MSGMIGIACSDQARHTGFYADLMGLRRPKGTLVAWKTGPYVPINRNELAQEALDAGAEWLWFLDDDHRFQPDILERLLEVDADVVVPFCLKRQPPFMPVVYLAHDPVMDRWIGCDFSDIPEAGLLDVAAAGTGGMLIRRRVLEQLARPWFQMGVTDDGVLTGEDLTFSAKLADAGFRVVLNVDAPLGHIGSMVVWPATGPDGHEVRLQFSDEVSVSLLPKIAEVV